MTLTTRPRRYRDAEDELVHKIFVPFDDVELSLAPWSIGSTEDTVPTITSWPDFCCLCTIEQVDI
jgi:hypothetical protein